MSAVENTRDNSKCTNIARCESNHTVWKHDESTYLSNDFRKSSNASFLNRRQELPARFNYLRSHKNTDDTSIHMKKNRFSVLESFFYSNTCNILSWQSIKKLKYYKLDYEYYVKYSILK